MGGVKIEGVWPDFQLSASKLHFTFQLLSVPSDSWQRERAGATGRKGGRMEELVVGGVLADSGG